jgi:hypothetical protein
MKIKEFRSLIPQQKKRRNFMDCDLPSMNIFRLRQLKYSWFLLLEQIFIRRISIIDAYLKNMVESTWKTYSESLNGLLLEKDYTIIYKYSVAQY